MRRPLLWASLIGCGILFIASLFPSAVYGVCVAAVIFLFLLILTPPFRRVRGEWLIALLLLTVLFLRACTTVQNLRIYQSAVGKTLTADLTVISSVYASTSTFKVRIRHADGIPNGITLKLTDNEKRLSVGDRLTATVHLDSAKKDNTFSALSDDFFGRATLTEITARRSPSVFLQSAGKIRVYMERLLIYVLPPDESAILSALALGDRSRIPSSLLTAIRRSGISHIFVVSGLHLSILVRNLLKFYRKVFRRPVFRVSATLFTILLLCAVCGFGDSVLRAGFAFGFSVTAPLFRRESDPFNTLGLTVLLLLLLNPFSLFGVSFQLSVLSVLGILLMAPLILEPLSKHPSPLCRVLLYQPILTLCAMWMTTPVIISCFGECSLVAPITNLLIASAVSVALLFTVIGGCLSILPFLSFLAVPFLSTAGMLARYLTEAALFFGNLPFAAVSVPKPFAILALITVIGLLLFLLHRKKQMKNKNSVR